MLIRINAKPAGTEIVSRAVSYLDVADELLNADGHYFKSGFGGFAPTETLSPALPEDYAGFNFDAFLDRVSTLATQV